MHLLTHEGAGTVNAQLIGASQTDPELRASFSQNYSRPRRDLATVALRRARDRGQIRDGLSLEVVVETGISPTSS